MTEFKIPNLGENVTAGDVTRVLVKVGDTIARDQSVLELETDKATIEVPSSVAGVVKELKVKQGDTVQVGAVVLTVDEASGNGAGAAKPPEAADAADASDAAPPAEPQPAPKADPEQHKVISMPARPSTGSGRPEPPEGRQPEPQKAAARQEPAPAPPSPPGAAARQAPQASRAQGVSAPAAPAVRRLAREIGVDINVIQGSGPGDRITQEDVKEQARRILSSVGTGRAPQQPPAVPLPDFSKWGEVDRQPMSNIRRKTAEHLSHAWTTIPHVTQFDKADITPMEDLRSRFRKQVERAGGNLTVTAVLVKVLAAAVKHYPQFNSSIDQASNEIVFKKYVNVGVAVDTDRGLLVPVIRNADQKNITQIAIELNQLAEKARDKKLTLDDMSGGGISISNLGGLGGTYFTPIVNWPEVAILGVSRGLMEPVWRPSMNSGRPEPAEGRDGAFQPRQMLPLSLSYDHRVIDGADAMRFLRWVVEAIEQPFLLSLLG